MQTTVDEEETSLVFSESEAGVTDHPDQDTKKDRKELFQINTHPATVLAANKKRDWRLKQIVMHVVAFCKKEHEEGQRVPFRFFKKRASLMTGVSLSTIHRIETIDMKAPLSPDPDSPSKAKPKKEGQKKAKKKKKRKDGEGHVQGRVRSVLQQNMSEGCQNVANAPQVHFQIPLVPGMASEPASTAKQNTKKKKKVKKETESSSPPMGAKHDHNIISTTTTSTPPTFMTLQPAIVHAVSTGDGMVTTINVQQPPNVVGNPAAPQQRGPCAWTAGPIGPFTMGELREGHQVQLAQGTQHLQINAAAAHHVGSAIPVGAQLQPISVTSMSQQAAAGFVGQVDAGGQVNWTAAGGMGAAFGALPTTATLVGQQVVQAYQSNHHHPHPQSTPTPTGPHTLTAAPFQPLQQHSSVFYQF
ncbi:hypothetical protein ACOMHN_002370 [Nucella lapillus]